MTVALTALPSPVRAQNSCSTDKCHSTFKQKKVETHPDDMKCTVCHLAEWDEHGKEGNVTKPTLAAKMCGDCHDELVEHQYPHEPAVNGECHHCHFPHGKMENMMLKRENGRDFYIAYSEEEYVDCFSCHKRDLLMYPETGFSTDFRDGIRNLHYLHVTKGVRGRNCIVCHDVHGSDEPKLMTDSIGYGSWRMPMGFIKTETGGGCAPGCHRVRQYDRKIK